MSTHRIVARRPKGTAGPVARITDDDRLRSVLEDAAHVAGHATGLVVPANEAEVAAVLAASAAVLPIGAQSSLTGGATPRGEIVVSTSRLNRILDIGTDYARVQPGVTLAELDAALAPLGKYYPPAPTFTGASVGGTLATNAAGAATFKYGSTRDWVNAITVVLPSGDVLDVVRGAVTAHADGWFETATTSGDVRVPVPDYRMPAVPKVSAGYFAAPGMDLIDLFIGSEGTLGFVVEATLRVRSVRPATCMAFVAVPDWERALALVTRLRTAAKETWHSSDQNGLDVSAIEHVDRRCLEIAQQDGLDAKTGLTWPARTACALIVTLELPAGTTAEQVYADIFRMDEGSNTPALGRFAGVVDDIGVLEQTLIATPGDSRMARIVAFREEVPASVNQRVGRSKMQDERIEKTAGDMIVPFDRLGELMALYDEHFRRAGLDVAVWGHISDGNLHPNVLPRTYADVERGREALIEIGREVIRMGGSPLAEHGVGRSALKQQFLRELYGDEGIEQMRRVKRALDPEWKLSPGVLFPR